MNIHVSRAEFNTILAALRFWQEQDMTDPANRPDHLQEIACPNEDDTSLDKVCIDWLCERINFD